MKNLIECFPKTLWVVDNVCAKYRDEFEEKIYSLKDKTEKWDTLNVNTSHSKLSNLNEIEPFDILSNQILYHAKEYMLVYGYSPDRVSKAYFKEMWFNISSKGDFLFPHDHKGSLLSGAYYIKSNPENFLYFHDDNKNHYEDVCCNNPLNETVNPIDCDQSSLILFHSNFIHSTPPQKNDGDKIVVSFNISL